MRERKRRPERDGAHWFAVNDFLRLHISTGCAQLFFSISFFIFFFCTHKYSSTAISHSNRNKYCRIKIKPRATYMCIYRGGQLFPNTQFDDKYKLICIKCAYTSTQTHNNQNKNKNETNTRFFWLQLKIINSQSSCAFLSKFQQPTCAGFVFDKKRNKCNCALFACI